MHMVQDYKMFIYIINVIVYTVLFKTQYKGYIYVNFSENLTIYTELDVKLL